MGSKFGTSFLRQENSMQINNSVIQLAKERALFGFSALMQRVVKEADDRLVDLTTNSVAGVDQYTVSQCRQFIKVQGAKYLASMDQHYKHALERAMQTMYTDLREGLANISADNLTLIDDATVNRQIELDKLVARLRDADNQHLKRLNLIIAQMHGDDDVKERENPFRPYLMASAMHEVLYEMIGDPDSKKMLFGLLSDALAHHVAEFYEMVHNVFESNGLHANLLAKPSRHTRTQRYRGGELVSSELEAAELNARILPNLERMLDLMQRLPMEGGASAPTGGYSVANPGAGTGGSTVGAGGSGGTGNGRNDSGAQGSQSAGAGARSGVSAEEFHQFIQSLFRGQPATSVPAVASPAGLERGDGTGATSNTGMGGLSSLTSGLGESGASAAVAGIQGGAASALLPGLFPDLTSQVLSAALVARLNEFQQQAAQGKSIDAAIAPEKNQLFAVGEQIAESGATKLERVSIDVVAMLFEFILEDEQIPGALRGQISRLQIPFLKAAMLEPALLQNADHPARQLLNRMGSAAVGLESDSEVGHAIEAEVTRIVKRLLHDFTDDCKLFATCLEELEQFLATQFLHAGPSAQASAEAIEEFEAKAINDSVPLELEQLLGSLSIDTRAAEFVRTTWSRVLSHEMSGASYDPDTTPGIGAGRILSELVWSAQDKNTPTERADLVKLLPKLVTKVRKGLVMAGLPDQQVKREMDLLVSVHTQVLRSPPNPAAHPSMSLAQIRKHFSRFDTSAEEITPTVAAEPAATLALASEPSLETEAVENALAEKGVSVKLDLQREPTMSFESDADWLTRMQIGTCIERWMDTGYIVGRLTWISKRKTLYMFHLEGQIQPVVYSKVSLIRSLREGSLRLVEYAPVFDRAVDALIENAKSVKSRQ